MAIAESRAGAVDLCSMRRARARDINLRYSRVTSVVVEPDFRLLWIRCGYVIEDQPLQRGSWPRGCSVGSRAL